MNAHPKCSRFRAPFARAASSRDSRHGGLGLWCGSGWGLRSGESAGEREQQGDRVVASNRLYGRTTQLLQNELNRFGIQTTFVNAGDLDEVRAALKLVHAGLSPTKAAHQLGLGRSTVYRSGAAG